MNLMGGVALGADIKGRLAEYNNDNNRNGSSTW